VVSSLKERINPSNPIFWGLIGALIGLISALGGEDNRFVDGFFGALIQFLLWCGVAWVVLKYRKKLKDKHTFSDKPSPSNQPLVAKSSTRKMPLIIWFLIAYLAPVVGGIFGRFKTAKSWSQISGKSQISIVFNEVMSPAGVIDTFIFPSLASAITITSSIFFYRKTVVKLKQNSRKPFLVGTYVLATALVWVLLSFALAYVVAA